MLLDSGICARAKAVCRRRSSGAPAEHDQRSAVRRDGGAPAAGRGGIPPDRQSGNAACIRFACAPAAA
jgi:hypothetical protein